MLKTPVRSFRIDTAHECLSLAQERLQRLMLRDVQVDLNNGELLLTGFVNTWHEKQLAQELVREVDAGLRIRNKLSLV